MSDFGSSLPVRTEANGDVVVKIADGLVPSQVMTVNPDGSINTNVTGADLDIRDLVFATDKVDVSGSTVALDSTTLSALESITVQNGSGASAVNIQDGGNSLTVDAVDLDIRDLAFSTDKVDVTGSTVALDSTSLAALENITVSATDLDIRDLSSATDSVTADIRVGGTAVSTINPIPVAITANITGTEVNDFNTAASVAAGASSNHDYTAIGNFLLTQVEMSGSGKAKLEIRVETSAGSGTFSTKFVQFNSTATPNMSVVLKSPITVTAGVKVRVVRSNRDNQAQDLYSTICGEET